MRNVSIFSILLTSIVCSMSSLSIDWLARACNQLISKCSLHLHKNIYSDRRCSGIGHRIMECEHQRMANFCIQHYDIDSFGVV